MTEIQLNERTANNDPLVTLDMVCNMNETMIVKNVNEHRAHKHAESKAGKK